MTISIFYVYQYLNEDGTPYYIGKGSYNRINESHLPWVNIPPVERRQFIQTNMEEEAAFNLELELIKKYGRKIDGGILENIKISRWVSQAGWNHSEETKQLISEKNKGKVRTEEHKKNYRKPKTLEHAEKVRQANLGKTISKDVKQKISDSLKGNIPWNKGMKGRPWSAARRLAQQKQVLKEI
jgi:NUMOD3 motif